jgi:hypothetical protein
LFVAADAIRLGQPPNFPSSLVFYRWAGFPSKHLCLSGEPAVSSVCRSFCEVFLLLDCIEDQAVRSTHSRVLWKHNQAWASAVWHVMDMLEGDLARLLLDAGEKVSINRSFPAFRFVENAIWSARRT